MHALHSRIFHTPPWKKSCFPPSQPFPAHLGRIGVCHATAQASLQVVLLPPTIGGALRGKRCNNSTTSPAGYEGSGTLLQRRGNSTLCTEIWPYIVSPSFFSITTPPVRAAKAPIGRDFAKCSTRILALSLKDSQRLSLTACICHCDRKEMYANMNLNQFTIYVYTSYYIISF